MRALVSSVVLSSVALLGCERPRPAQLPEVSQIEWTVSRARLANVRAGAPSRPYVERVRVSMVDPTGRTWTGRGAVAINPSVAARMMLLGPAGTTAIDVWVTKDRFRFSVPAVRYERRGGADPADARGLPIGMLRWWFLSPLEGRLLMGRSTDAESAWLLKDGTATVAVRTDGRRFVAVRREAGDLEAIEWLGRGLVPSSGARGRYLEGKYGLRVEVIVEEVLPNEPDPEAFADPDAKGTEL
ncbi:MAG TPA: hypothetical protein VIF62_23685 [Labilithrix sp.]|jgi:hypothetical protein